jgi:membrane-bound ClpP family serine protease
MAFLRWERLPMAEELPETAGAATRNLLGAVGFILILLGSEILLEKTGERFSLGVGLVSAGMAILVPLGVGYAIYSWRKRRKNSVVRSDKGKARPRIKKCGGSPDR